MPLVTQLCQLHHLVIEALNGSGPGWAPVRATSWAGSVQDGKVSGRQRLLRKGAKRKRELKVPEDGVGQGKAENNPKKSWGHCPQVPVPLNLLGRDNWQFFPLASHQ